MEPDMGPLVNLSDVIRETGFTPTGNRPRPRVEDLVRLPSTSELEAELAQRVKELEVIQARPASRVLVLDDERRAKDAILAAERRLDDGRYRDTLQAERPDDCWCLGEGGRDRMYFAPGIPAYRTYCECPIGQAAQAAVNAETERFEAEQRARNLARLFDGAKIPTRFLRATFDSFPVNEQTAPLVQRLRDQFPPEILNEDTEDEWQAWEARDAIRSWFFYGPYGVGKTGLAVAYLRRWLSYADGEAALFITVPTLLDRIRETYGPHAVSSERELIDLVKTVHLLVLDDLGAERVTDWVAEKLFTIINHRHDEDLETIFTSNLSIDELAAHIGERTTWRIVEMCEVLKIDGPNLRDRK